MPPGKGPKNLPRNQLPGNMEGAGLCPHNGEALVVTRSLGLSVVLEELVREEFILTGLSMRGLAVSCLWVPSGLNC